MKKTKVSYKNLFWILWVISLMMGVGFTYIMYDSEKELQQCREGCVELSVILLEANTACMEYANLTNEEFGDIYFEWGVEKIRREDGQRKNN